MAGKYLIDTNIAILFLNNKEFVVDKIIDSDQIFICSIVAGELLYGARKSAIPTSRYYHCKSLFFDKEPASFQRYANS